MPFMSSFFTRFCRFSAFLVKYYTILHSNKIYESLPLSRRWLYRQHTVPVHTIFKHKVPVVDAAIFHSHPHAYVNKFSGRQTFFFLQFFIQVVFSHPLLDSQLERERKTHFRVHTLNPGSKCHICIHL